MIRSLAFALVSLMTFSTFAADSCAQFVGKFKVTEEGCMFIHKGEQARDSTYKGLEINFSESSKQLSMVYKLSGSQFTVNTIADGKMHEGDSTNTGKTYVATCDNNTIFTTRNGMLKNPLLTVLFFTEKGLRFEEAIEGSDFTRVCDLVKI